MKKFSELKWKAFEINELFNILPGKRLTKENMKEGNLPFIGSTDSNNGITAFCGNINESLDENVLGVNYNGSVVENFYHPYKAIFSDDVKRLHLKNIDNNLYICLFVKAAILKQKRKFEYGYKFNGRRMEKQSILLPATSDGSPDYAYMEEYMRSVEKGLLGKYSQYIANREMGGVADNGQDFKNLKWKAFKIEELFKIKSGHDIYQKERTEGETPYVSATATQNGIGYFVGNSNETLEEGCLSVNRNGSVGYAFYHPYKALFGNDTRKLVPYCKNKYVCLFMAKSITLQKDKYGYGLKMGTGRLKKQSILLPANSDGSPDYAFMERFMKTQEVKLMELYVNNKLKRCQFE